MERKDKIKIIRATTDPSSLNIFCRGLLKELNDKYEVIALSSPGTALETINEREGVRTIAIPMQRRISLLKDIKSLFLMIRVLSKERPTIVHSMTPKAGLLCMMAAKVTNVPIRIHTFTGLVFPSSKGLMRRVLMMTDWLTCACATHIIPEGEGVKEDLLNNGITKKPLKVLGFGNVRGVDLEFYSRRPEVMRIASNIRHEGTFSFLFVGRIVKEKGIDELCHAMNKLINCNVRLLMVGQFEDSIDPISNQARELIDNLDVIEYVGPKYGDELLAYYAASDCFVLPSYREGFPNTVLEAGAMGLPCIVTDINGSREIIKEGINGMIVPPKDAESLVKAMRKMLNTDRKYMADNARGMIESRYDQSFVWKCLFNFYEEVLTFNIN